MTDLSKSTLEEMIKDLKKMGDIEPISIKPTKLWIPIYPNESIEEYQNRCLIAQQIVKNL